MTSAENGLPLDPVVTVLGRMSIATAAGEHTPGSAGQRLLAMLAASHPDPVAHGIAAEGVYPATDLDRARRALQSTVWRLRQATAGDLIVTDRGAYRLGVGRDGLDLTRFEDLAVAARDALVRSLPEEAEERARLAVACWAGEPFVGLRDIPGAEDRAATAAATLGGAIEDWADAAIRLGQPRIALDRLVELSDSEPLRERAWTLRLDAFRALDQWDDVASTRSLVVEALAEVGVEPGPDLQTALDRTRRTPDPSAEPATRRPDAASIPAWMGVAADHDMFIGREAERRLVRLALDEVAGGRTRVVAVRGEPGAGKTRLACEVGVDAAARSTLVLGGRCDRHGLVPFAPLIGPLRRLMEIIDPVAAARLTDGPLGRLLEPGSDRDPVDLDVATEQMALFGAAVEAFRELAGDTPTLLVVDDIQWASSATVLLLRHVATVAPDLRLCILVTARDQDGGRSSDMDPVAMLSSLESASVVTLGGLSIDDIADHPGVPAADRSAVAEGLFRQTGGNPLLLTTVLRLDDGADDDRVAPLVLGAAIDAHLERFGVDEQDVLGLAAAAGTDVDPVLARIAGSTVGLAPSAVNDAFNSAERAGVVRLDDAGSYVFRHELLRDGLLDRLSGSRRAEFHAALADAIESRGDVDGGPALFELAHHLHQARSVVWPERIRDVAIRAARTAGANLDFESAAELYERAADASGRARSGDRTELLLTAALCHRFGSDLTRASDVLGSAIEAARTAGDPLGLARAVVARGQQELQISGKIDDETARHAESAYDGVVGHDPALAGKLWFLRTVGDHRMDGIAHALGMIDGAAAFHGGVEAFRVAGPGDRPAIAELIGTAADGLEGVGPRLWALLTGWIADVEQGSGHVDDPVGNEFDRVGNQICDQPFLRWIYDTWTVARHLGAGRLLEARRAIDDTYSRARHAGMPVEGLTAAHAVHRGHHMTLAMMSGVTSRVDHLVEPVARHVNRDALTWDVVAAVGLGWAGRAEEALPRVARACDLALAPGRVTQDRLGVVCLLTPATDMAGDTTRAALIRDELARWRGRHAVISHTQLLGAVDHYLGIAHRTLGEFDASVDAFAAARDQQRRQGAHGWVGMSTVGLVRALSMRDEPGDRAEAIRLADDIVPWADAAGMQMVVGSLTTMTEPFRS